MKALYEQRWLEVTGTKLAKVHFKQPLYKLGDNAEAALELSKKDFNVSLKISSKDELGCCGRGT